jgi:hypothetical protein
VRSVSRLSLSIYRSADGGVWVLWDEGTRDSMETGIEEEYVAAFTVAELGEMLPPILHLNGPFGWSSFKSDAGEWLCKAEYYASADQEAESEADARAKMLIYLLENKLITI